MLIELEEYLISYDKFDYLDYKCPKKEKIIKFIVTANGRSKCIGNLLLDKMEKYK